jgi:hypothetical protein
MPKSFVFNKVAATVAILSIANCSAEDRCNFIKGSEISCRPGFNDPPPPPPRGQYSKTCEETSSVVPDTHFVTIVYIEPVKSAQIVCFYTDSDSSDAKGRARHYASDQGYSFTMPCQPEWPDSAGRKAILQYEDNNTASLKIITAEGMMESETSFSCSSHDTR